MDLEQINPIPNKGIGFICVAIYIKSIGVYLVPMSGLSLYEVGVIQNTYFSFDSFDPAAYVKFSL